MIELVFVALKLLAAVFKSKSRLEAENAALRQQLIVLWRAGASSLRYISPRSEIEWRFRLLARRDACDIAPPCRLLGP
jgi:hypothetical protein